METTFEGSILGNLRSFKRLSTIIIHAYIEDFAMCVLCILYMLCHVCVYMYSGHLADETFLTGKNIKN